MISIHRTKIKDLPFVKFGECVCIKGWVKTTRISKNHAFINVNDGSTLKNLQIVATFENIDKSIFNNITTGVSLQIEGKFEASQGELQSFELIADKVEILGDILDHYPLQPKNHSLEFLREIAHLRFRTNTFGCVFRIRNAVSYAIHKFFYDKGFVYIHTPIITAIDAEGAGSMFDVTTLDVTNIPKSSNSTIDYTKDFFGKRTHLTVSGQLEAEAAAMGLCEVYTFGPTFRAENSNTTRHLAEFWMVEPEMAFYDLSDNMALAEEFLKYIIAFALDNCKEDLSFLSKRAVESTQRNEIDDNVPLLTKLESILNSSFNKITYTEVIDILKTSKPNTDGSFAYKIKEWGCDLQSEHERYLVETYFKSPIIVTDYPEGIKAFYMRNNSDNKTVAAMDVLFPGIGEIIGGSQREERLDKLIAAMDRKKIKADDLQWYLDTRKFGGVPHSGFGLGLERLIQFITGMGNIRDVISFPRTPGNAAF